MAFFPDMSETMSGKDMSDIYGICFLTFFLASYLASILTLWLASFCEGMNGYPLLIKRGNGKILYKLMLMKISMDTLY
jgi:hypothetical protein